MKIKAILFDADGVIQMADGSFVSNLKNLVPDRSDEFVTELFSIEGPAATGIGDFRAALNTLLDKWKVDVEVDEVLCFWQNLSLIDGLFDFLAELRNKGFITALATNQQAYRMAYMREELKLDDYFDRCFYSCEVGFKKPDLAYFEAVTNRLNLSPGECLFIDDSQANVESARAVGLKAVQYQFRSLSGARDELNTIVQQQLNDR